MVGDTQHWACALRAALTLIGTTRMSCMARPMEGHLAHPLGSSRPLGTSLCTPGAVGAGCPFASPLSCPVTAKSKGAAEWRLLA